MGTALSHPRTSISLLPAALVDAFDDRRDLIVGQFPAAGSAVSGNLLQNVQALTRTQIEALLGAGDLYYRVMSWLNANGSYSPLDVIPVDPAGGATAATAVLAITGPATADGTLVFEIIDAKKFTISVSVVSGETATQIGDKIDTAVAALTRAPFTSNNAAGTVTFTAIDLGTIGNNFTVKRTGQLPGGVAVGITDWSGGTGTPTVTTIFDVIDGVRYTGIGWPQDWNAQASIVKDLLDARFNAANAILDGTAFSGFGDTYANILTELGSHDTQSLVLGGNTAKTIVQPPDWTLSTFMGIRARRLTPGAPVADQIVTTAGRLDAIGGPASASLPYFNTPLDDTPVVAPTNLLSATEQADLESKGFTVFGPNRAGSGMIMGPVVTTRTTDGAGNSNASFLYLNYVDTGSVCREVFFNTLKATFAQCRLTEGDLVPDRSIVNEEAIKGELLRIYRVLADLALVQKGSDAEAYFADETSVTIALATRTVTINGPLPIVTQVGAIDYVLQLAFTVGETGTQITF